MPDLTRRTLLAGAAATAPQKLPIPPMTMMRNAGITTSIPTCGRRPQIGTMMMPASPASPAPSPKTRSRSFDRS